jgi:hypothetical protein
MRPTTQPRDQAIGWNGITMQIPTDWQPVVILDNYLLFEDSCRPILEMKWQQIHGSLSSERIIRRLRKSGSKQDTLEPWKLPDAWQQALHRFDPIGFRWQGARRRGRGVLLYCATCGRATLVQFYDHPEADVPCRRILASLRDHTDTDFQHWAVYDVAFTLPVVARLQEQKFLTGSYTISFRLDDLFLSLLRMKPAEILLAGNDLLTFGRQLLKNGEKPVQNRCGQHEACWLKQASRRQRFLAKLKRQQADHCLLLRHLPEKNALLGLRAACNRPIDLQAVHTLFTNYTIN